MKDNILPGSTGEPLPNNVNVIRLIRLSNDGRASDVDFELSSEDKSSALQSLSVWEESLTTPFQARFLIGEKYDSYEAYCLLNTDVIRSLRLYSEVDIAFLDVVWDNLENYRLPGSEGHAGIKGLFRPPGMDKLLYKRLRSKLAMLANERLHIFESD